MADPARTEPEAAQPSAAGSGGGGGGAGRSSHLGSLRRLVPLYFELRRRYIMLRHRNVKLAPGVRVDGKFSVGRRVKVYIGEDSRVTKGVAIDGHGTVVVGRNTLLNGPWIGCWTSVTIGDDCIIASASIADTDFHNLEPELRHAPPGPKVTAPIVIENNVWVGGRAAITKGVTIGSDSVVGRSTVVRRSVPPRSVVIGNPQQIVKTFAEPRPAGSAPDELARLDGSAPDELARLDDAAQHSAQRDAPDDAGYSIV